MTKEVTAPRIVPADESIKFVDNVLRTEDGKKLFAWLHRRCGYSVSVLRVSRSTGDIAPLSVEARGAERDVYVDLRRLAGRELLAAAEFLAETPAPPVSAAQSQEERKK